MGVGVWRGGGGARAGRKADADANPVADGRGAEARACKKRIDACFFDNTGWHSAREWLQFVG